jgi:hypothetical protein
MIVGIGATALLAACAPKISETNRIPDPTGAIDAIAAIRETDATVATPTEVYLTPAGGAPKGDPVFRADNVEHLNVEWLSQDLLHISAESARIFLFSSKFVVHTTRGDRTIRFRYDIASRP